MLSSIFVPLSVLLANLAGFIIQLVVPRCLSPSEYAQFAVLWSIGQFVATLFYEWQRFAVIRFSVGADEELMRKRRVALMWTYIAVSVLLAVVAGVSLLTASVQPLMWSVGAVAVYAIFQGTFEGRQALARAEFANRLFSSSWLCRTFLSMLGAIGVAMLTRRGVAAVVGLAVSYPLTLLIFNFRSFGAAFRTLHRPDQGQVRFLFQYGIFAAASTTASNFLPAAVRVLATHTLAASVAGGMLLALDIAQKAILMLGVAVNIVVVQQSIHAAEFGTEEQRALKLSRQIAIPFALLLPAAVGFYMIQPAFAALAVPAAYRAVYLQNIGWSTVGAGLLAFRLYGIDPLFVVAGRSLMSIFGPIVSVVVTFCWVLIIGERYGYTPLLVSQGTAAGLAIGAVVALVAARFTQKVAWPLRDFGVTALATVAMALAMAILPRTTPVIGMGVGIAVGGAVFAAIAIGLNVVGLRDIAVQILRRGGQPVAG